MRQPFRGGTVRLKYLKAAGHWPSGNARLYVRKGGKLHPMPDAPPENPAFLAAYARACGMKDLPEPQHATGTIGAAITAFLASDRYLSVAKATRARWRRVLDDMRRSYGAGALKDLQAVHIRRDLARLRSHAAIARLKVWRALCGWCAETGLRDADPTQGIPRPKAPASDGHPAWTRAEVTAFRDHWQIETPQRLAFELLFWTGARISDACRLGDGMIGADGWLTFRQAKTGGLVQIPLHAPAPDWAEPDAHLAAALSARSPRHLVFMVTTYGQPRTVAGASQWFAAAARSAGVAKSAHGLRKLRANLMAENGATTSQIAAWTGHLSLSEVDHYTRAADRRRLVAGTNPDAESGNSGKSGNSTGKTA